MGGRGASSKIPTAHPGGGGGGGNAPFTGGVGAPITTLKAALGKKVAPMSMATAVTGANPNYSGEYREFSENCQRAVIAYEARRRGYNVTALPTYEGDNLPRQVWRNKDGSRNGHWMGAFKNAKSEHIKASTPQAMEKELNAKMASYGNGSRAIIAFGWKRGNSGHVVNVERKNGKTYFNDAQIGAKYKPKELFNAIKGGTLDVVRTDNLKLSDRAKKSVTTAYNK